MRTDEKAGVEGRYDIAEVSGGTHLEISLVISVDLPFPGLAKVSSSSR